MLSRRLFRPLPMSISSRPKAKTQRRGPHTGLARKESGHHGRIHCGICIPAGQAASTTRRRETKRRLPRHIHCGTRVPRGVKPTPAQYRRRPAVDFVYLRDSQHRMSSSTLVCRPTARPRRAASRPVPDPRPAGGLQPNVLGSPWQERLPMFSRDLWSSGKRTGSVGCDPQAPRVRSGARLGRDVRTIAEPRPGTRPEEPVVPGEGRRRQDRWRRT